LRLLSELAEASVLAGEDEWPHATSNAKQILFIPVDGMDQAMLQWSDQARLVAMAGEQVGHASLGATSRTHSGPLSPPVTFITAAHAASM
jgi:hypothetical protein